MTDADVLADLDRALAATEAVVAGIREGPVGGANAVHRVGRPGVLNHLVSGNLLFARLCGVSRCRTAAGPCDSRGYAFAR